MTLSLRRAMATVAIPVAVAIAGCGGGGSTSTSAAPAGAPAAGSGAPGAGTSTQAATNGQGAAKLRPFSAESFGNPATGANRLLPLKPGLQWTRVGFVNVGSRRLPHRVVSTVTDVTKMVDGVRTVLVLDQDTNGGQVAEQSLDYVAEDRNGDVWYLGSYTESYEGGQFLNASDAWLAGTNGAKPGVLMPAAPKPGMTFTEDTIPGGEAPSASVVDVNQSQCVPFRCFNNALVLQEGSELKYFAPGVGQIKTAPQASSSKQEVENLQNVTELSPQGLAQISREVLKLDQHAAVVVPEVFGHAPAAKRTL